MKGQTFNCSSVRLGLVLILYLHDITATYPIGFTSSQNRREIHAVRKLIELENIKQRILNTLEMRTEDPHTRKDPPRIDRDHVTEPVTKPVYKRTELRVYDSEKPGKHPVSAL